MISRRLLDSYYGYSMRDICPHGFDAESGRHDAHFVSDVLQMNFGCTCAAISGRRDSHAAANIRVQEIFDRCHTALELNHCTTVGQGLIIVSKPSTFSGKPVRMRNVRNKHIGILLNGKV